MKKILKDSRRLIAIIVCAMLIINPLCLAAPSVFSSKTVIAAQTNSDGSKDQKEEVKNDSATEDKGSDNEKSQKSKKKALDKPGTVLTFTSDIHNGSNNTESNRLDKWLDYIQADYGKIDVMSFCGDMGAASGNGNSWWGYVQSVMDVVDAEEIPGVYTTGNH